MCQATAAKGSALTPVEQKRIKYARHLAPPNGLGAINRPEFVGPKDVEWP